MSYDIKTYYTNYNNLITKIIIANLLYLICNYIYNIYLFIVIRCLFKTITYVLKLVAMRTQFYKLNTTLSKYHKNILL